MIPWKYDSILYFYDHADTDKNNKVKDGRIANRVLEAIS